jgi:adenosylcobinamide-phosphate synthase
MASTLVLVLIALAVEAAVGWPDWLYRWIGHPVTWIGALIAGLDRRLNREGDPPGRRRLAGVAALLVLLAVVIAVAVLLSAMLGSLGVFGLLVLLPVVASSLFAQRSLHQHVAAVRDALRTGGLEAGRRAVSMIVGRNPAFLNEPGVARAAIESLAENFSDGVTAPVFWTAVAGLPGGAAYKAINTADSMIGHRTPRHEAFGWASARLDDLVNLPASRLSALLLVAAAAVMPEGDAAAAARAVRRDARHHRSPNAGWPEAAMAGALGLRLNGPRTYGTVRVDDRWMGEGRAEADADDIDRALRLYRTALVIQAAGYAALLALVLVLTRG